MRPLKAAGWTIAFGSLFVFAQSYALSLQGIQINSALGEPLDAVVQVNAAPGEFLKASCMRTGSDAASGMPAIRGVRLSLSRQISPGTLRLTTQRPVTEPMSEVVVQIDCPGAPAVRRSFLIMLDPRGVSDAATSRQQQSMAENPGSLNPSSSRTRPLDAQVITSDNSRISVNNSRRIAVSTGAPVAPGSRYVVANGDSLSTIASRISGRDYGTVWSWAATIEAANPHAFINRNPNELIAGSELYIPPTLAAGTTGLTIPVPTAAPALDTPATDRSAEAAAAAVSRISERLSTGLQEPSPGIPSGADSVEVAPLAVTTAPPTGVGSIRAIQPVMAMATSFSSVSRDRLRQRQAGLIQSTPANLPDFARNRAANDETGSGAAGAQNAPTEQPVPGQTQSPDVPVATKPEAGAAPTSSRRFSFFGLLAGLGLLAASFFAGWMIARRRADAVIQDEVEARLSEERYRERIRSGRQSKTNEVLSAGAASGIQVTESERESEPLEAPENEVESEGDLDEISGAVASDDQNDGPDINVAEPITDNQGPLIEPEVLNIDTTGDHTLADIDLELLERDYAAQTETNTNLEDIASAGKGNKTTIMETSLDLEFPEELKMRRESEAGFDTLEFDPQSESLDFDIGEGDRDSATTEELSLDLEEAGANIDAQLEELRIEDNETDAGTAPVADETGGATEDGLSVDDLVDGLPEDDEFSATSTRDAEEFYHLEASSIMNVGELDFEKEPDDETNILRFRQRNIRTGTDDSSGDEE